MFEVKVNQAEVMKALEAAVNYIPRSRQLMGSVAGIMLRAVEDNFAAQGRPQKWQDLADSTKKAREARGTWPGKILQESGRLAASMKQEWDDDSAQVGSNVEYAAIQNFGGTTKAHVILPRNGRALSFNGIVVRKVNHPGSTVPARPYLVLTEGDEAEIVAEAQEHIARGLGAVIAPVLPH